MTGEKNFLNLFKKKKDEESMELRRNFISTLWAIWFHRNEIVFNGGFASPSRIMEIYMDSKLRHSKATKK